jgi:hypothetical protein
MMRDNHQASNGQGIVAWRGLMPEHTYNRENEIDTTKATAHLPGLDIDIIHHQSRDGDWEQISINLRAKPSFEALGRSFEVANPFSLWVQAVQLMWMPWLLTAQTMTPPDGRTRTLPGASIAPRR